MKISRNALWALLVIGAGATNASAASTGTDVMGAPSNWRGTLLEGTDALIASNNRGEPLFVKINETVAPIFSPAPIDGKRLATEFKNLCMDTNFNNKNLDSAIATSKFSLSNTKISIPPAKNRAPYEANVWHSPEARIQIWTGDLHGLEKHQTLSRWRRGATASPFDVSRVLTPSCNLTVMSTGFQNPQAFLDAMSTFLRAQPTKAVTKPEWADGHWSIANSDGTEIRIVYSMVDFDKSEQLLHIGIAQIPAKKR